MMGEKLDCVYNQLYLRKNISGVTLVYIIRKYTTSTDDMQTRDA